MSRTIPGLLEARCAASPASPAFLTLGPDKRWHQVTWEQFAQKVTRVGGALNGAGIRKGDRVGIFAPTSLEWEYAQMGALAVGAIVAGIDPGYPPDQLSQVMRLLDPSVLFVQDQVALAKIPEDVRSRIKLVVVFAAVDGGSGHGSKRSMHDFLASSQNGFDNRAAGPEPQDAAVMVFSSGTTGLPKAVVFSHEQVRQAVDAILAAFDDIDEGTVLLCWLPLANLFQRVINFCAMGRGATSYILSDPRTLMEHIRSVEPHILIGVPRVFEHMQAGVLERIGKLPIPIRHLAHWSLRLGREHAVAEASKMRTTIFGKICWHLANKLILNRLRAAFGGQLRYFVSGSAGMPLWLLEWFDGLGLPVLEAYGISENIVPISANRFSSRKPGTVGKPLPSNRISLAPDGEILVRGPGVFGGYWGAPGTADERFMPDGSWRSGDIGRMDGEGFLSLLGRKSEAFKTSGGKWISPMRVEERVRRVIYIRQSIVLQLDSGAVGAILSVDKSEFLYVTGVGGSAEDSLDEERFHRVFTGVLQADLKAVLADLPAYQRPVGVVVTFHQFSVEGGELTTNLKIRRQVIIERFAFHLKRLETATAPALKTARSGSASFPQPVVLLA